MPKGEGWFAESTKGSKKPIEVRNDVVEIKNTQNSDFDAVEVFDIDDEFDSPSISVNAGTSKALDDGKENSRGK